MQFGVEGVGSTYALTGTDCEQWLTGAVPYCQCSREYYLAINLLGFE